MTRKEAIRQGKITYCTGKPCSKGHFADKYVKNWTCVTCALERMKTPAAKAKSAKWRADNVVHCRQQRKIYSAANRARIAVRMRAWRKNRREENNAVARRWASKNRVKANAFSRAWRQENKDIMAAHKAKRRVAMLSRTPFWLSRDARWMVSQAYALAVQRTKMFGFAWHVDHVVPLQGKTVSGLHVPWNLQVIPGTDNLRKSNRF